MPKIITMLSLLLLLQIDMSACAKKITSIQMTRTPCYGECPWYSLTLYADGSAMYDGKKFTPREGVYSAHTSTDSVSYLFRLVQNYKIDTCQDTYNVPVTDLPGINYIITYKNGKTKSIQNANFGPQFLVNLAKEMDKFLNLDWASTNIKSKN